MPQVWCVRADGGVYAEQWVHGGFAAISFGVSQDLQDIHSRDELYEIVQSHHPGVSSNFVLGNYVGQIARFVLEIRAGDYVITPAADTEWLHYGQVQPDPSYSYQEDDDVPQMHRRRIAWAEHKLRRTEFSVPFQNTIRSSLTVFLVSRGDEFLSRIGVEAPATRHEAEAYDPYRVVLDQILELDASEFEALVGFLLTALGFEGSEVVGGSGDGGVDATGELNASNLAKVKIYVQAKRYKIGSRVSARTVRELRQAIPFGGQGAFITTADYQPRAADVATEPGFPRIGLINGYQLVDLLVEHWESISGDFRERLSLRPGLVRS
ncbi:MAG: restriction endonuclease [Chloroflexota bacterium]|nr:restriction endonuclease [Chloroflexota bacterium]